MKTLQRYVLREVLAPTVLALVTLTFVLLIQMLFRRANELTGVLSLSLLFRVIWYVFPTLLTLTVPMAVLTGVLLGIGRLTVDSEIKACRTHGVNLFPILAPVLVLGVLAAAFSLFNGLSLAPELLKKSLNEIDQLKRELIYSLEPGRFESGFGSRGAEVVLYFEGKDPATGDLRDVYVCIESGTQEIRGKTLGGGAKTFFLAASGKIISHAVKNPAPAGEIAPGPDNPDKETGNAEEGEQEASAPSVELVLSNGTIHFLREQGDTHYTAIEFKKLTLNLDQKIELQDSKSLAPTLTFTEFQKTIRAQDALHRQYLKDNPGLRPRHGTRLYSEKAQFFRAELFQRISISLACFSFALIGLPLSIYIRPSGKSVGITIAFLLIMAYYGVMHYGVVLTRQDAGIGPEVGPYVIFLPNVVLTVLGGVLLYRTVHR